MSETDENANRGTMKSKVILLEEKSKRIFFKFYSNLDIVLI